MFGFRLRASSEQHTLQVPGGSPAPQIALSPAVDIDHDRRALGQLTRPSCACTSALGCSPRSCAPAPGIQQRPAVLDERQLGSRSRWGSQARRPVGQHRRWPSRCRHLQRVPASPGVTGQAIRCEGWEAISVMGFRPAAPRLPRDCSGTHALGHSAGDNGRPAQRPRTACWSEKAQSDVCAAASGGQHRRAVPRPTRTRRGNTHFRAEGSAVRLVGEHRKGRVAAGWGSVPQEGVELADRAGGGQPHRRPIQRLAHRRGRGVTSLRRFGTRSRACSRGVLCTRWLQRRFARGGCCRSCRRPIHRPTCAAIAHACHCVRVLSLS